MWTPASSVRCKAVCVSNTDLWHAARLQDKIEDLQSKLAAVQEQRTQLRSRSRMLATALQLRKEELRKLRERQAQVSAPRPSRSGS